MLLDIPFDQRQIAQLFDLQPDAVVWYVPIFKDDSTKIIDFVLRYCNSAASKIFNVPMEQVTGTKLSEAKFLDDITKGHIFQQCNSVWLNDAPIEFTYYSPVFDRYFNVQRTKAINGILSITRDRTEQVIADTERERQNHLLNTIANSSPACLALCEAIRSAGGAIEDFRLLMVNDKIAKGANKLKEEVEGMTFTELNPAVRTNGLLEILTRVVETGKHFKDEIYLDVFGGWFLLTVNKVEDERVIAVYLDINETKKDKIAIEEQAEWFNNILSHAPSGIIVLESVRDVSGEIVDFEIRLANKAGKIMGNLPANPIGKKLLTLFPELRTNSFFDAHKRVVETGESFRTDIPFSNGNATGWYQFSLAKLSDGLIVNFTDVSEIKQYEETIRAQADELQSILNGSLNGVFAAEAVRNSEGRIIDFEIVKVNASFSRILKLDEKDVIGKLYSMVFTKARELGMIEMYNSVVETGKPIETEVYYKDGKIEGWYLVSINKWGDHGFVQTFQDYTSFKNLQHQLELTIQGLRRSNERLTEFSHVASHDLNEPLRKVITFSKLLNDRFGSSLETGAKDYLDRIEKTAQRMQVLLENLLIYSRVSKQINTFEQVNLNTVIQEVVSDLETFLLQKKAKVKVENLPVITGERTQLRQLFQNLITNAVKFQRADNMPELLIRHATTSYFANSTEKEKPYHLIEVVDNGIGFDPAESEKIFQLFHRLHARHEYEGTGIGLAIVQRAMENHHGFVEAVSEPGKGSTFKLYFPT